ncbi:MAG: hypothetical protein BWY93_01978 [Euryarchaeota archaeon ADurb.BinA087]|nr:MAG: hypothetical protein BWY93_01978 [Euryarchaeota archaeon ADurb.BinA087]
MSDTEEYSQALKKGESGLHHGLELTKKIFVSIIIYLDSVSFYFIL